MGATEQIVFGAILLLLGAILIGIIADTEIQKTSLSAVENELIDISVARLSVGNGINVTGGNKQYFNLANVYSGNDGWKSEYSDCNVLKIGYGNDTNQSRQNSYWVSGTDYTISTLGVLRLYNTTKMNASWESNLTYIDYKYCSDDYIAGWGNNILNLLGGMMAIMLVAGSIAIFFRVYQDAKGL